MNLKKLAAKAFKHRKMIVLAATLVAPGVVAKVASKVAKVKDRRLP